MTLICIFAFLSFNDTRKRTAWSRFPLIHCHRRSFGKLASKRLKSVKGKWEWDEIYEKYWYSLTFIKNIRWDGSGCFNFSCWSDPNLNRQFGFSFRNDGGKVMISCWGVVNGSLNDMTRFDTNLNIVQIFTSLNEQYNFLARIDEAKLKSVKLEKRFSPILYSKAKDINSRCNILH